MSDKIQWDYSTTKSQTTAVDPADPLGRNKLESNYSGFFIGMALICAGVILYWLWKRRN